MSPSTTSSAVARCSFSVSTDAFTRTINCPIYCAFLPLTSLLSSAYMCIHVQLCIHVGSGGRAVERRTVNRGDGGSIPPTAVSKLRQFRSPHICLCLSEEIDIKSRWSLLTGVYARGSKISHTGGKCVTCSGLTNS